MKKLRFKFGLFFAFFGLAVHAAEKEAIRMFFERSTVLTLRSIRGSQTVSADISAYFSSTPDQRRQGIAVAKDINIVFKQVRQEILSGRRPRGVQNASVGFSLDKSQIQLMKLDPEKGTIQAELLGYVSYPQLNEFATAVIDSRNNVDQFVAPKHKTKIKLEFSIAPKFLDQIGDQPVRFGGLGVLSFQADGIRELQSLPFQMDRIVLNPNWNIFRNFRFEVARSLCVQPIRIQSSATDSSPTGAGLAFGLPGLNTQWSKADVGFRVREWMNVTSSTLKVVTTAGSVTSAEETQLMDLVSSDDCIEVFFVENFSPESSHGGGATWGSGSIGAKVISSDGNAAHGIDKTHLAHEFGHVLGLKHPGSSGTLPAASSGTLMCPSGWMNDNPEVNSQENMDLISNPLLKFAIKLRSAGTDCEDSADCGSCF